MPRPRPAAVRRTVRPAPVDAPLQAALERARLAELEASRVREQMVLAVEVCQRAARGDLEGRMPVGQAEGDAEALAQALNHLLDVSDGFQREARAALDHAARGKFFRRVLLRGIPGSYRVAAQVINGATANMAANAAAISGAQKEIRRLVDAAASGDLSERARVDDQQGELRALCEGINQMLEAINAPLTEVASVLDRVAAGDLTRSVDGPYQNDLARLQESVNGTLRSLRALAGDIRASAARVAEAAGEISSGTEDLARRTDEQASSLQETASAMEEMTATVKQNADNASQADRLAAESRAAADQGGEVLRGAVAAMREIEGSSSKIAEITDVIDEIAFQTNLLALNAAVEAARAGEQGRGFAVVASEVRNLAQRSATAAKEIKALIKDSVEKVQHGSRLVGQSEGALGQIVEGVKRVASIVAEISAASREQSVGIEQVNEALVSMDEVTRRNAGLVEQTAGAANGLAQEASAMRQLVSAFRLESDGELAAPAESADADERPALEERAA